MGLRAPMADEETSLIPGFIEGPPQGTGMSAEQRGFGWVVGGIVVAGLAVAVIIVLAVSQTGHPGAANPWRITTTAPTSTGSITSSPAASSSAPTSASGSGSGSGSGSTSTANRLPGRAQASIIAGYLTDSGQARQGIGAAISAISDCSDIAPAVSALQNAAEVRSRIVTALASANVSALPNGAAAVADLGRAMQASADADRHYAAWGQSVAGCHRHAPHNAEFTAAQQSDTVATAAKQRFADEWNPIAATYGLAKQSADTI
jgi:hypothetical protein